MPGDSPRSTGAAGEQQEASNATFRPFGDSPRLSCLPPMETLAEVRGARRLLSPCVRRGYEAPAPDAAPTRFQAKANVVWTGPTLRTGVAEEMGSRRSMEDASVALDDADDLGLSYPRGFYAVRGGTNAIVVPGPGHCFLRRCAAAETR
jgi:hypothetical protein